MVSRRFRSRISGLELHVADIQSALPQIRSVDLVFAALILEYVNVAMTMGSLQTLCAPDGALVVILQADGQNVEKTSPSPYKSIQLLAPAMRLLGVDDVKQQAVAAGFSLASSRVVNLRSGKDFVTLARTEISPRAFGAETQAPCATPALWLNRRPSFLAHIVFQRRTFEGLQMPSRSIDFNAKRLHNRRPLGDFRCNAAPEYFRG
jgi:hypothetical protein